MIEVSFCIANMSNLALYHPMTDRDVMGNFETEDVKITSDIDSFLISCTSLEPFNWKLRFQFLTGNAVRVTETQNIKFTKYVQKRKEMLPHLPSSFCVIDSESIDPDKTFYEFELGYVDNCPLYCVFQYDETSSFFEEASSLPAYASLRPLMQVLRVFRSVSFGSRKRLAAVEQVCENWRYKRRIVRKEQILHISN